MERRKIDIIKLKNNNKNDYKTSIKREILNNIQDMMLKN